MSDDPISEHDGPTLEEMDRELAAWRASVKPIPRYGHVGHPVAVPTCPLCIALSDSPEVKA